MKVPMKKFMKKYKKSFLSEIRTQKSLSHENICKCVHHFEANGNIYIVLEMCPNEDLKNLVVGRGGLTEIEVRYFTKQIMHALMHIKSKRVIHRDIKPANIFLNDKL